MTDICMRFNVRIIAQIQGILQQTYTLCLQVLTLFFLALKLSTSEENSNYMLAPGILVWSVCVVTHGLEGALTMWNKILMIAVLRQGKIIQKKSNAISASANNIAICVGFLDNYCLHTAQWCILLLCATFAMDNILVSYILKY